MTKNTVLLPNRNLLTLVDNTFVAGHYASNGYGSAKSAYDAMAEAGFSAEEAHEAWRAWISLGERQLGL